MQNIKKNPLIYFSCNLKNFINFNFGFSLPKNFNKIFFSVFFKATCHPILMRKFRQFLEVFLEKGFEQIGKKTVGIL